MLYIIRRSAIGIYVSQQLPNKKPGYEDGAASLAKNDHMKLLTYLIGARIWALCTSVAYGICVEHIKVDAVRLFLKCYLFQLLVREIFWAGPSGE